MTEEITLTIEKLVHEGFGMGRWKGQCVFVPLVLPGETVRVRVVRRHRRHLVAELLEVLEASGARLSPPCPYFGTCGGCQWMHIAYETQLIWKQKILEETLKRTAGIESPAVLPTLASPKPFGWRSRVTVHTDEKGNTGFFRRGTHQVVDVEQCLICEEGLNERLRRFREEAKKTPRRRDEELRSGAAEGFSQVNPDQNKNLREVVRQWAEKLPHDHLVELFCGSGNLTEVLMPMAQKITAVDSDRAAIQAVQRRLTSAQFFCTDAIRFWSSYQPETPVDLLVLDPPRDGAAGIVEGVLKHRPKNILYVSCQPSTLARDLKFLKDFAGYTLVQTQPIDMFPMSYHIESVSWIRAGVDPPGFEPGTIRFIKENFGGPSRI